MRVARHRRPARRRARGPALSMVPFTTAPGTSFGASRRSGWRRRFPLLFALAILAITPALVLAQGTDSVTVSWTSTGDDGMSGTATAYDLRMSDHSITAGNFKNAQQVTGLPAPQPSGTSQSFVVHGLTRGTTYYFALRTGDDRGNWSGISNLVKWDWPVDPAPPSTPHNVQVTRVSTTMQVTWDASTDPNLAGYNVYRSLSNGPFVRLDNVALLITNRYVDSPAPSTSTSPKYQVTTVDMLGHESAPSRQPIAEALVAAPQWSLLPSYPNPSHLGASVHLPIAVPAAVTGDVSLEIVDGAGQPVRRLTLTSPNPGTDELVWDGRNDAGRATAPGVYRGWLTVGGTRSCVRLLRVP